MNSNIDYLCTQAKSAEEAERGLLFMQEMIELSKSSAVPHSELYVSINSRPAAENFCLMFNFPFNLYSHSPYHSQSPALTKSSICRLDHRILRPKYNMRL